MKKSLEWIVVANLGESVLFKKHIKIGAFY